MDSDDEQKRRRGITALGAVSGGGLVAGLGLSALLAGNGFSAVALAAMLLSLVSLVLTVIAVPETHRVASPNLEISTALRVPAVRRAMVFVALCAALQAAFLLTLPVYFASALGSQAQATTALIALLVVVAAVFQVGVLPRLLSGLGVAAAARLLLAVALCTALFIGIIANGAVAVVLAAALLTVVATSLAPVGTLLLAESYAGGPVGLTMGLNTSSATVGQIVGPLAGYAAFALGGAEALGLSCVALTLCAAGILGIRAWLKIGRRPD